MQSIAKRDEHLEVTPNQIELIKKTVAKGANQAELELFFYDCRRRGVHPLDRLLHFTKRGDKYTPITSIDFMRSQAAESGEYAGNDDALFIGVPKSDDFQATVTVYRLVQGIRCAFSATARWSEYCPKENDFMWRKMPHTMIGKCAESLALRKAFPQQLSGLYSGEEMAQAGHTTVEAEFVEDTKQIGNGEYSEDGEWKAGETAKAAILSSEKNATNRNGLQTRELRDWLETKKGTRAIWTLDKEILREYQEYLKGLK